MECHICVKVALQPYANFELDLDLDDDDVFDDNLDALDKPKLTNYFLDAIGLEHKHILADQMDSIVQFRRHKASGVLVTKFV